MVWLKKISMESASSSTCCGRSFRRIGHRIGHQSCHRRSRQSCRQIVDRQIVDRQIDDRQIVDCHSSSCSQSPMTSLDNRIVAAVVACASPFEFVGSTAFVAVALELAPECTGALDAVVVAVASVVDSSNLRLFVDWE